METRTETLAARTLETVALAQWGGRGRLLADGGRFVGVSRAGVAWVARPRNGADADAAFEAMVERFDARECYVARGLALDVWGDDETVEGVGACPCGECRTLRAEAH